MPLRVLLITEYFWPDEAGTGRYLGELVQELGRQVGDLEFEILTSRRLFRTSVSRPLAGRDDRPGMRVRRVRSLRTGQDGFLRRLVADVVFTASGMLATVKTRADCVFVVSNPPLMPLLVAPVARGRGLPMVYLVHDLYPDVPIALGVWSQAGLYVRLLRSAQGRALRSACKVIVLGRCMKSLATRRYGLPEASVESIPHWPTLGPGREWPEPAPASDGVFRVVYSGNLGRFQDFETLLDAAERLAGEPKIQFRIFGDGARAADLKREVARRGLTNVVLGHFLDEDAFWEELTHTHLGVVTLEPQLEGLGVPSKTYNLLAAGVPLCAVMSGASEVAQVIEECGCGIRVDHGDSAVLAEAILGLQQDEDRWRAMGDAGRRYVAEQGTLPQLAARYRRVLTECAGRGRRTPAR